MEMHVCFDKMPTVSVSSYYKKLPFLQRIYPHEDKVHFISVEKPDLDDIMVIPGENREDWWRSGFHVPSRCFLVRGNGTFIEVAKTRSVRTRPFSLLHPSTWFSYEIVKGDTVFETLLNQTAEFSDDEGQRIKYIVNLLTGYREDGRDWGQIEVLKLPPDLPAWLHQMEGQIQKHEEIIRDRVDAELAE